MWYLVDRISGILAPERWYKTGRNTHEAERKIRDAEKLKEIRRIGQVQFEEFVNILDISLLESIKRKQDVVQNVKAYGKKEIADLMK